MPQPRKVCPQCAKGAHTYCSDDRCACKSVDCPR
jgi:hypothetical protein